MTPPKALARRQVRLHPYTLVSSTRSPIISVLSFDLRAPRSSRSHEEKWSEVKHSRVLRLTEASTGLLVPTSYKVIEKMSTFASNGSSEHCSCQMRGAPWNDETVIPPENTPPPQSQLSWDAEKKSIICRRAERCTKQNTNDWHQQVRY